MGMIELDFTELLAEMSVPTPAAPLTSIPTAPGHLAFDGHTDIEADEALATLPLSPIGKCAVAYAVLGIPIFPVHWTVDGKCGCSRGSECDDNGKHPLIMRWNIEATTEVAQVMRWWQHWRLANVAMASQRFVIVDVDPRHGGQATLDALIQTHGDFTTGVPISETGGGGTQMFFREPTGYSVGGGVGLLGQGVDVRARGGYCVLPPSMHRSGNRYWWSESHPLTHPRTWPVCPPWIVQMITTKRSTISNPFTDSPGIDPATVLAGLPDGERNVGLFHYASKLRGEGRPYAEAKVLMLHAASQCTPQYPQDKALTALNSAYRRYEPNTATTKERRDTW